MFRFLLAALVAAPLTTSVRATPNLEAASVRPPTGLVRLPGHVTPALAAVQPTRALPGEADEALTLTIVLNRTDQAGFDRFLRDVYDPASREFRRFRNAQQLTARFGPTRDGYVRVRDYLRDRGLTIVAESANRLTLTVRGTRRQVERALHVHVRNYRLGDRFTFANDRDPAVSSAVAADVQAIVGLSGVSRPHRNIAAIVNFCFSLVKAGTAGACDIYDYCSSLADNWKYNGTKPARPNCDPTTTTGFLPGTTGLAVTAPAGTPPEWRSVDGTGQKIGLLEFDAFNPSDIRDWIALFKLPANLIDHVSQVHVNGGAAQGPAEAEVLVDVVTALGIAPGADVVVYDAPFTGAGSSFQTLFNAMIDGNVTTIGNSWTYCEDQTTLADVQSIDAILQTAAAAGISVFNASGDTGSTCLDGAADTVGVPSSSPSATAVGGSSLPTGPLLTYTTEAWWDGAAAAPPTGQGGFGVSRFFDRPSYQNGFTGSAKRSVPDLVANADPTHGVVICQGSAGGCPTNLLYGGTSMAAPEWAAFAALLNQAQGQNLGALNPLLYPLANTTAFHSPASLGSDFAHVGLGSPNLNRIYLALSQTTPGAVSAAVSLAEVQGDSPGVDTAPADGTSLITVVVRLRDAAGNSVGGRTVTLTAPGSAAVIQPPSAVSSADDGSVAFTLKDLTAETFPVTATNTTDGVVLTPHPSVTFTVPAAAAAGINASPGTVTANGSASATITVTLQDALARPTPGKVVTLAQGSGHSLITPPTPATTDVNGQIAFAVTNLANETVTYTAVDVSDGDLPVPGSAQVVFNAGGGTCGGNITPPVGANGYGEAPWVIGFQAGALNYGGINFGNCAGVAPPAFLGTTPYVANSFNGDLFKLDAAGGTASNTTKLSTVGPTLTFPVFGPGGHLYANRQATTGNFTTGALLELDPVTGATLRALASNLTCPAGLAVDPLSGDLFFDDFCFGAGIDANVYRVRNPTAVTPTVEVYAALPAATNGQLTFAPSGTLYVVSNYNQQNPPVVRVSGTNGPVPPTVTTISGLFSNFWVSIGEVDGTGEAKSLITLLNNNLQIVDITVNPPVTKVVMANGIGGGSFGPDGCLYQPFANSLYKLTDPAGGCNYAGPHLGLTPAAVSPDPAQGSARDFTAKVLNAAVPVDTPVYFRVTGANPRVQMVRTDAAGQATLTYTAANQGHDVIVAATTVGTSEITSNPARVTWAAGKGVTFLSLDQSPRANVPGEPVTVSAVLTNTSTEPPTPVAGVSVQFTLGGAQCSATTDANGVASCELTPSGSGIDTLTATFAGTGALTPATTSLGFNVVSPPCIPVDCDDADVCTDDACVAGTCTHTPGAGYPGVTCYLDAATGVLQTATPTDAKAGIRKSLQRKVRGIGKLVQKAQAGGKKGAKARRRADRRLTGLLTKLGKLHAPKIDPTFDQRLAALVAAAKARLATIPAS